MHNTHTLLLPCNMGHQNVNVILRGKKNTSLSGMHQIVRITVFYECAKVWDPT